MIYVFDRIVIQNGKCNKNSINAPIPNKWVLWSKQRDGLFLFSIKCIENFILNIGTAHMLTLVYNRLLFITYHGRQHHYLITSVTYVTITYVSSQVHGVIPNTNTAFSTISISCQHDTRSNYFVCQQHICGFNVI